MLTDSVADNMDSQVLGKGQGKVEMNHRCVEWIHAFLDFVMVSVISFQSFNQVLVANHEVSEYLNYIKRNRSMAKINTLNSF